MITVSSALQVLTSIVYEAIGFKDPRKQISTKHSGCAM